MPNYIYRNMFVFFVAFIGISSVFSSDIIFANNKKQCFFSSHEEYRQFIDDVFALKYNYCFVGEIVDTEGRTIPDVVVLSSKSNGPMTKFFDREKIFVKNGSFSFYSKGVFSWGLTFEKSGYYNVIIGMGISNIIDLAINITCIF